MPFLHSVACTHVQLDTFWPFFIYVFSLDMKTKSRNAISDQSLLHYFEPVKLGYLWKYMCQGTHTTTAHPVFSSGGPQAGGKNHLPHFPLIGFRFGNRKKIIMHHNFRKKFCPELEAGPLLPIPCMRLWPPVQSPWRRPLFAHCLPRVPHVIAMQWSDPTKRTLDQKNIDGTLTRALPGIAAMPGRLG